jgi:hypothetical protein
VALLIREGLAPLAQELADYHKALDYAEDAFAGDQAREFVMGRLHEVALSGGTLRDLLIQKLEADLLTEDMAAELLGEAREVAREHLRCMERITANDDNVVGRWPSSWSRRATDLVHGFGAADMGPILQRLKKLEEIMTCRQMLDGLQRYCRAGKLQYGVGGYVRDPWQWSGGQPTKDGCSGSSRLMPEAIGSRIDLRRDVAAAYPQARGETAEDGVRRVQEIMQRIDKAHTANPKRPGESGGDYVRRLLAASGIEDGDE